MIVSAWPGRGARAIAAGAALAVCVGLAACAPPPDGGEATAEAPAPFDPWNIDTYRPVTEADVPSPVLAFAVEEFADPGATEGMEVATVEGPLPTEVETRDLPDGKRLVRVTVSELPDDSASARMHLFESAPGGKVGRSGVAQRCRRAPDPMEWTTELCP